MVESNSIRRLRNEKGLTQAELAKKAGLSEISIRKYENGDRKPKIEALRRIAAALGVGLETFLTDAELSLFESMANLYLKLDPDIKELEPLDEHTSQESYLIVRFRELNEKGRGKVVDYADDLAKAKEYTEKERNNHGAT